MTDWKDAGFPDAEQLIMEFPTRLETFWIKFTHAETNEKAYEKGSALQTKMQEFEGWLSRYAIKVHGNTRKFLQQLHMPRACAVVGGISLCFHADIIRISKRILRNKCRNGSLTSMTTKLPIEHIPISTISMSSRSNYPHTTKPS